MKHIEVLEPQLDFERSKIGRRKVITKEQLINAIQDYGTDSPSTLAEKLNVSRMTIYRRLKEIPRKKIDSILRTLADSTLKPSEMDYDVFEQIPIVQRYRERMLYNRKVSDKYLRRRVHSLHRICCILRLHPSHLDRNHIEKCAMLVGRIEKGEITIKTKYGIREMRVDEAKKTLRSWFETIHALSGQYLTSHGISCPSFEGKRSRARLTREHRKAFMKILKEKTESNWKTRTRNSAISIPFGDRPDLRKRMLLLPKAFYYWGSRKTATLEARIEDMEWHNPIAVQKVIDKGEKTWYKRIAGDLLKEFKEVYEFLGEPEEGRWFTFRDYEGCSLFKECYREAGIPEKLWKGMPTHIWRHTACQDLLEATEYNYELVAEVLGWESVDTMKKYYGRIGERKIQKGMLKAMGIEVKWEKREFKF